MIATALTTVCVPLTARAQELQRIQTAPVVNVGPAGFSISSPENGYVVKLRGTLHFDHRRYIDDVTPEQEDTFILRRVRPTLEGTLSDIYDFRFTPDFAGGRTIIVDAFATARFKPWLRFTAGKFKVPVGLERLQSANDLRFVERGLPTSLVPNRDLGVSIGGDIGTGELSYSIGYFNGVSDGGSSDSDSEPDADSDGSGDWAARLFVQPFSSTSNGLLQGLGIGIAATYGDTAGSVTNTLLPSYRTPGQQTFFSYRGNAVADGERLRVAPQFQYYLGRFGVLGEYVQVTQGVSRDADPAGQRSTRLVHSAWQAQLSWFITGEVESFRGSKPLQAFSVDQGTWGAFELVVRLHELDIDDEAFFGGIDSLADPAIAATLARARGVGLNWYFNQNFKLQLSYDVTRFEGGAPTGNRGDEQALFARLAVAF